MANFHLVPRGDAIRHKTLGADCPCRVETRTWDNGEGGTDTWYYHRAVPLSEAVMSSPAPLAEVA